MSDLHLPVRPNLDQLKHQAKEFLAALRKRDPAAIDALWNDRIDEVRRLISKNPRLVHENARATQKCNWGPPMSYAANLGRNEIIRVLHDLGAQDHMSAIDRATLQ